MRRIARSIAFVIAALTCSAGPNAIAAPAQKETAPIPREILFGNAEKAGPQLSPDGKKIAWLAPDERNVLQVFVQTVGKNDARAVTKGDRIEDFMWTADRASNRLIY